MNVPREIIAPLSRAAATARGDNGAYKSPSWEPGSEVCVQIIDDVRSIAGDLVCEFAFLSFLGPPRLNPSTLFVSQLASSSL